MEKKRFIHKVKQGVQEFLGEEVCVEVKQVVKNNNVILDGLLMKAKHSNLSPTIYLDECFRQYEEGKPVSTIVYEIIRLYEEQKQEGDINMDFFLQYENVKHKIVYKLISYAQNEQLLKEIPHIPFLDMAIVFYCIVANDLFENATILIYNSHCHMWNVGVEEIYEAAKRNTPQLLPADIQNIEEIVGDMIPKEEMEALPFIPMYILSNDRKIFGAACLLYDSVLDMFASQTGQNICILPSSIHEVILIPDSGDLDSKRLEEMVYDVNHTQLDTQEILSDRVYKYDRKLRKVCFLQETETAE